MRICLLARANYELVRRRVAHFAARGHDTHVISMEAGELADATVHLPARTGGHGPLRYALATPFVYRTIARLRPDVVDAHGVSTYGLWMIPGLGAPRVATVHGPDIYDFAANSRLLRGAVRALLKRVELVFGSTPAIAGYVRDVLGLELGERLKIHSWGIPFDRIVARADERRREIRTELGVRESTRVIVHCRQIAPIWRPHLLLEALPAVVDQHPDTELWYIYPPPNIQGRKLLERLQRRRLELGLESRVRLFSLQPYERYVSLLHAADLYSCIGENDLLASTLLEALATGLVPVLADLPAYRQVITDGDNGFLLPEVTAATVASALIGALDRQSRLQPRLAQKNRALVAERFDDRACSDWLLARYSELVERRPSR